MLLAQELSANRLERGAMLLTEFEHAPHGFLARRLRSGIGAWLRFDGRLLGEREDVLLQWRPARPPGLIEG